MLLYELAKDLGVENKELVEFLGKNASQNKVDADDIAKAEEKYEKKCSLVDAPSDDKIVRFWTENKRHTFKTDVGIIYMEDYKLDVDKTDLAYAAIVKEHDTDVRIIINKPFKKTEDRAAFTEMLDEKMFTGVYGEPSLHDGLAFLSALFKGDELDEFAKLMSEQGPKAIVQLAVDTKSYIAT